MRMALALVLLLPTSFAAGEDYRLGVWNIEKLSTKAMRGFPEHRGREQFGPRTDEDLEKIATYLQDEIKPDCLILTEIDDDGQGSTALKPRSAQLDKVVEKMGDNWKYYLGRTGGDLRIGVLFNGDRIKIKRRSMVNLPAPEFKVADEDVCDRDPFIVYLTFLDENGNEQNDLFLIGLHLKSGKSFIHNHMAAVAKVLGDLRSKTVRTDLGLPPASEEDDYIIVGDCNDNAHKRTGFKYIFDYLEGAGYDHLGPDDNTHPPTRVNGSQIDHIFVSKNLLNNGIIEDSFKIHTVPEDQRLEYRKVYSDHFPVTVDLTAHEDEDGNN